MKPRAPIFLILCLLAACGLARTAFALEPDEIALIVNTNVGKGLELAEFYAQSRNIPANRIISISVPPADDITFDRYERDVVPPIRAFLREKHLDHKVKCLVTFTGVPLRIAPKTLIVPERQELIDVTRDLTATRQRCEEAVIEAEKVAAALSSQFVPGSGNSLEQLSARADVAMRALSAVQGVDRAQSHEAAEARFTVFEKLVGIAEVLNRFDDATLSRIAPTSQPAEWPERRKQVAEAVKESITIQDRRFDPMARQRLRELIRDYNGLLSYAHVLQAQADYLTNDGTAASLDNELAMLWFNYYLRARWVANPLHFRTHIEGTQGIMVMRIDGPPEDDTAKRIIVDSIRAEKNGLKGLVVVDSTGGTAPGGAVDRNGEYGKFDRKLLDFAAFVRDHTKLEVRLDERPSVFPPNSIKDPIALYCGWYNLRNYTRPGPFATGAVGYHIASAEMITLRRGERGWAVGLLEDGAVGTLGPVAEPYLHAFPLPDEFFPLLLTGKLTLAEVYWKTTPLASWMIAMVGDPLYNPFKDHPALEVKDLPDKLQPIFNNAAPFPTAPASQPAVEVGPLH